MDRESFAVFLQASNSTNTNAGSIVQRFDYPLEFLNDKLWSAQVSSIDIKDVQIHGVPQAIMNKGVSSFLILKNIVDTGRDINISSYIPSPLCMFSLFTKCQYTFGRSVSRVPLIPGFVNRLELEIVSTIKTINLSHQGDSHVRIQLLFTSKRNPDSPV